MPVTMLHIGTIQARARATSPETAKRYAHFKLGIILVYFGIKNNNNNNKHSA